MKYKRIIALAASTGILATTSILLAVPAQAVGTSSWNCTLYSTFTGKSTPKDKSYTSGPTSCGKSEVSVGYNVSGGTALYTKYKQDYGNVTVAVPGYVVFEGRHMMSNPAPAYSGQQTT